MRRRPHTVNANGVNVASTYDLLGRLSTPAWPDGGVEAFGYTANVAGPASFTNQIDKVTSQERERVLAFGTTQVKMRSNMTAINYPSSPHVTLQYDALNRGANQLLSRPDGR